MGTAFDILVQIKRIAKGKNDQPFLILIGQSLSN